MTSPSTHPAARRRQRSTRVTVAVGLLVLAAVLVVGAVATGQFALVLLSAVAALVLGAASTRITWSELVQTRRDAAADRARQAQAYRDITARRAAENVAFAQDMRARIAEREEVIGHLEVELGRALERAATSTLKMSSEARRADLAESQVTRLTESVEESETRAAEAIVRVAELEAELDGLRSELDAWKVEATQVARKRA
ncbi:hypothetical protein IEQ44_12675 [Nocardioides sp. Y6]|uniref:Multidomain membrane protein n=1 Tax=Nocardioides malaquae TaxID=2773426 RepID=A0ABR9RVC4_9ACTN|nr:hypothetical protein [Nocardioides malaquae]MBE7325506.1 hypothetical protein [Nocardioides malaquae]